MNRQTIPHLGYFLHRSPPLLVLFFIFGMTLSIVYAAEGPIPEAMTLDQDIAQNTSAHDLYEIGKKLENSGDYLNASITYQLLTKQDPGNATVWHATALALVKCKKYNEVLEACNTTLLLNPIDDGAWCMKCYALRKLGRYEEALSACNQSTELNPKSLQRRLNRGYALIALSEYSQALLENDIALEIAPNSATAWGQRAVALVELLRFTEAEEAVNKAIALEPNNAYYWNVKGEVLLKGTKYQDALSAFNRSLELNPNCELPFPDSKTATMNREEALQLLELEEQVPPTAIPLRGITSLFGLILAWWIYRKQSRVFL
jgi:tetratricopeptide (TPR) repeat protein